MPVALPAAPTPLGTWYSVQSPGAVGNGTTDDTGAFTETFNACPPGGTVYIPPLEGINRAYIVSNVNILKPVTVIGGGTGQRGQSRRTWATGSYSSELVAESSDIYSSSRIRAKPGTTGYMFNVGQHDSGGTTNRYLAYDGALDGVFMRDLYLDGSGRTTDCGAIQYNTVQHGKTERLLISDFCRESLKFTEYVREYDFDSIWTFYCGNTTDGQGPAPAYYPCVNLFDNSAGADLHNLLTFSKMHMVFNLSDAVQIDTQATVTGSQVRDISFVDSYAHGPVPGISGFPYTISTLQQQTTTFQIKSCANVRLSNVNVEVTGTADGTGAGNFIRQRTGTSGVAPSIIQAIGCTFLGRYSYANTPRYGVWLQNGDQQQVACHIDGGDTAATHTEAGATLL